MPVAAPVDVVRQRRGIARQELAPAFSDHVELQRVGCQAGWPAWPSLVSCESPVPSAFMM